MAQPLTCGAVVDKPVVAQELDLLDCALDEIGGLVNRLRDKLEPVMNRESVKILNSANPPSPQGVPCAPHSPIADRLSLMRDSHTDSIIVMLNDMLNRLEI
jgi:hypothetical protein